MKAPINTQRNVQKQQQVLANQTPRNAQINQKGGLSNKNATVGALNRGLDGGAIRQLASLENVKDYSQINPDFGFEIPEDEEFNAHLLEGFTEGQSHEDPETNDDDGSQSAIKSSKKSELYFF